jgi:hypothetical protein
MIIIIIIKSYIHIIKYLQFNLPIITTYPTYHIQPMVHIYYLLPSLHLINYFFNIAS